MRGGKGRRIPGKGFTGKGFVGLRLIPIRYIPVYFILLFSAVFLLVGCGERGEVSTANVWAEDLSVPVLQETGEEDQEETDSLTDAPETAESMPETEEEEAFEEYDISLMAVGDNLMHMGIVNTGKQPDGSYDFSMLFEDIAEYLEAADIKIINQETILGGNEKGFSGYPAFNSPTEVGDAIAAAGFNVVLHATNHAADQKVGGIDSCIDFWKTYPEVLMLGIHKPDSEEPVNRVPVLTIKGVDFAILNYTFGPNYEVVSSNVSDRLELLCAVNEKTRAIDYTVINPQVLEDIRTAREIADVVIVCPHWGTENSMTPTKAQEKFAQQMTDAGADLIVGTHPHVVQRTEWLESESGGRTLCFYSLGNYVSTMKGAKNMLEGMAWVTFHVTEEGVEINSEKTGMLPMVCQYSYNPNRFEKIYLLDEYSQELASVHGIIPYGGITFSFQDLVGWSEEVIGDWKLTREEILDVPPRVAG